MKLLGNSLMFLTLLILTSFTCWGQVPGCTEISIPTGGSDNIAVDTDFEWAAAERAEGYFLTIGTSAGGADILDNQDVGDVTMYDLADDLPNAQNIHVSIIPYNADGSNVGCSEINFSTVTGEPPRCTEIINPSDNAELVAYNQNITWIRDFSATGYFMTIRVKDPDGAFLLNMVDVGNGTNFKPPDFEPRTRYYVTMIPYNDEGIAEGCEAISFITGDGPRLPECPQLVSPLKESVGVPRDTGLEWETVSNVDGYIVSVGTDADATNIMMAQDLGTSNFLQLPDELPIGTRIYVKIVSYKGDLESENCIPNWFVVEAPSAEAVKREIPKFFTPNNDGFNDTWAIDSSDIITVEGIHIFDRYGKLLKQLDPGQNWNGTFNGKNLPADSYWYELQLLNAPKVKGYFLLKR